MADRRRRRGSLEIENNDTKPVVRKSECESEHGDEDPAELSEYESADEEKKGEEEETESEEETETETESEEEEEDEDGQQIDVVIEDDEWVDEERQSGDGEEQPDSGEVDDDEDRKNPAFVPRKGAFYEHDLRLGDAKPPKEEDADRPKKKLWKDDGKWLHDGYNEALQGPKSTEELVAIYGYDVRSGSHPPEYRPRPRRGGTGRGRRQNNKLGDFLPNERSGGNSDQDYHRSKSEETEYIPMEYRNQQSYRATDNNDSRPAKSQSYNNNRYRDRPYNDGNQDNSRNKGNNYQSDYSNKRDNPSTYRNKGDDFHRKNDNYTDHRNREGNQGHYESKGENSSNHNRGNNYQTDYRNKGENYQTNYRNKGENYQSNYDKSQDFRNTPNNQGQHNDNYKEHGDYYEKPYDNYRGRGRRGRGGGRGRGQRRYEQEDNSGAVNVARQFTNSSYKSPENGDKTRYEGTEEANKENVQNISVTISNETEKAAYESESRRMKYVGGKPYVQEEVRNAIEKENMAIGTSPSLASNTPAEIGKSGQVVSKTSKVHQPTGSSNKADSNLQGRPKRYSSQRQRTAPDVSTYNKQQVGDSSPYYNQASTYQNNQYYTGDSQSPASGPDSPAAYQHQQQQPILPVQTNIPYPHPVSSAPRLYTPAPPAIATQVITPNVSLPTPHPTMIPPPNYLGQGPVIYGTAPPGINPPPAFPVPLGYTGPNPPQQIQSPPAQQPEVYRGGTIYYPPELQQNNPHRSPVRRTKSAIPIVKPQEKQDGTLTAGDVEYVRDEEQPVSEDPLVSTDNTDVIQKELSEISSALINLEGELRAGSTKVRQKEEDLKNLDLQKKLDSYLQSEETVVKEASKESLKTGASHETPDKSQSIENLDLNSQTDDEKFKAVQKGEVSSLNLDSLKSEIDAIKTESVQSVSGLNTDQSEKIIPKDLPSAQLSSDAKNIVIDNTSSDSQTVKEGLGNISSSPTNEHSEIVDTKSDIEIKTEISTETSSSVDN